MQLYLVNMILSIAFISALWLRLIQYHLCLLSQKVQSHDTIDMDLDHAVDTSDSRSDSASLTQSIRSAPENSFSTTSSLSEISNCTFIPSQDSPERPFRKVPSLNKAYEVLPRRNGRRMSRCQGCLNIMNTSELDRLVTHIKNCHKTSSDLKENVIFDYQKSLKINNDTRNRKLTRFLAAGNIGIRVVHLKAFHNFIEDFDKDYKPPTRRQVSERFIPLISHEIEQTFVGRMMRETRPQLSIEFDHWTDANRKSLLGVIATTIDGKRFVIDFIEEHIHTAVAIVEKLQQALNKIPSETINAVISDSASSCIKARQNLTNLEQYKHVISHRCIAHLLNRIGGYLSDSRHNPAIAGPLSWARELSVIAMKSSEVRRMLRELGINQVKIPTPTRWYSTASTLKSLLAAKEVILKYATSLQDCHKEEMILDEANWTNFERLKVVFDPLAHCIAVAEKRDSSLGEAVKCIFELGRSLFQSDWNDPYVLAAVKSYLAYIGPAKLKDEFGLLLAAYLLDRRYKLDYLTDEAIKMALVSIVEVATKSGLDIRSANRKLLPELHDYCAFEDDYATDPGEENAIEWWKKRHDSGRLQQVALRFACLKSSSANIERTFSAMKYVQGCWRMNLSNETMKDLVRIRIDEAQDPTELDDSESQGDDDSIETVDSTALTDDNQETHHNADTQELNDDLPTISDTGGQATENLMNDCIDDKIELLDNTTRRLYVEFVQLVDFSRVNEVRPKSQDRTGAPSARQLVSEFCRNREIATSDCNANISGATSATDARANIEPNTNL